jgi:TetR/AcrR family transcriptional regulator, transcriptional repressor of bet genes
MTEDTPRERKERKANADRRRRQILDATCRSIAANGLSRTTLATVAAEAGLSQGVAVFYFKSKDGLLAEALRDLYQVYETTWQGALAAAPDEPAAQLVAILRADYDDAVCNPETLSVWFAFWGEQSFTPRYAEITREYDHRRSAAIRDACLRLLPGARDRALCLAEWIDTLTDGYWQHLHIRSGAFDKAAALAGAIGLLCALMPERADDIRAAAGARQ